MSQTSDTLRELSFDEFDELDNPRPETSDFDMVVEEALSRRGFLGGVLAFGTASFLLGTSSLTPANAGGRSRFAFDAVPAGTDDTVVVPNGFRWQIVVRWGDPLWSKGAEFDQATCGTGESQ